MEVHAQPPKYFLVLILHPADPDPCAGCRFHAMGEQVAIHYKHAVSSVTKPSPMVRRQSICHATHVVIRCKLKGVCFI